MTNSVGVQTYSDLNTLYHLVAGLYAYAADDDTGSIAKDALRRVDPDWYAGRFELDPEVVQVVHRELLAADDGVPDASPAGSLPRWTYGFRFTLIGWGILITDSTGRVCWFNVTALPPPSGGIQAVV